MWKRVTIIKGLYVVGLLDFPLYREDGSAFDRDYSGDAFVTPGQICITTGPHDIHPIFLRIAEAPTQESADRDAGTELGRSQKRQVWPAEKSDAFVWAWKDAWRERGKP